jgi:hypothetical protein
MGELQVFGFVDECSYFLLFALCELCVGLFRYMELVTARTPQAATGVSSGKPQA